MMIIASAIPEQENYQPEEGSATHSLQSASSLLSDWIQPTKPGHLQQSVQQTGWKWWTTTPKDC